MSFAGLKRREFITLLGCAASTWSFAASAQASLTRPSIGFLAASSKPETEQYYSGFLQGMREFGYVEDRDYVVEDRYADGDSNRLSQLAQELLHREPDVIVADSTPGTLAAKHATAAVPIVGINMTNPVGLGLVESEARPGTNVTGTLIRVQGLAGKLLGIALDLVPSINKIGILVNPSNPSNAVQWREAESAAAKLGVSLAPVEVRTVDELGPAFQTFAHDGANTVIVFTDALLITARRQIAAYALASRLPTIYSRRDFVEDGGLLSYGVSQRETHRRAAYFVARILKGAKPADLPIEFSTKLELVINVATAKAIGLTIPPTLLANADEVIE